MLATFGGVLKLGLEYTSVLAVIECEESNPKRRKRLFKQVRLIEAGALSVSNDAKNIPDNATH